MLLLRIAFNIGVSFYARMYFFIAINKRIYHDL